MYDLTPFGLNSQQSRIYQQGLILGISAVSRIARSANVHRVTTYDILKELVNKGYATSTKKGNITYYQMVHPDVIHTALQEKTTQFESIIPGLTAMITQNSSGFQVQVFEGFDGVCNLYNHLLNSCTELKIWLGVDHIDSEFKNRLYQSYLPKRVAKKINARAIVGKSDHNTFFADSNNVPLTEVRIIDSPKFDLSCEKILFGHDKILIASMKTGNISGILIESKLLHDSYTSVFEWMREHI